ncbi:MAG: SAM-dependent chlorinase/fluorinase [Leptolyngbyaceae bacterium]|nr:SAM-dependent chlorinase/fluorinase [Leptolyngbyaceae bacterium]
MLITLLTDFGVQDTYVGVMKGVIAHVNPTIRVIDITHAIPPQDVAAARFNLMTAYPHFPAGTVHLAVVDPGVGGKRRAIAIQCRSNPSGDSTSGRTYIVAPDNGLVSGVIDRFEQKFGQEELTVVELNQSKYWYASTPSTTFHGRDIFAPVAAHLASGVAIQDLGSTIPADSLVRLSLPPLQATANGVQGVIQYIDHFGNLVTNIPGQAVKSTHWSVSCQSAISCQSTLIQSAETYGTHNQPGERMAIIGSHGWVEIAVNCGHAARELHMTIGDEVQVLWD